MRALVESVRGGLRGFAGKSAVEQAATLLQWWVPGDECEEVTEAGRLVVGLSIVAVAEVFRAQRAEKRARVVRHIRASVGEGYWVSEEYGEKRVAQILEMIL